MPYDTRLSIEAFFADKTKNFAYMLCSLKKKSLNRKNDSNRGGGEYRKFDEFSSQMRKPVIKSYAEKVIAHASANGGICRRSPNNSDNEEEEEVEEDEGNSIVFEEMGTTGLVFRHDNSDNECEE